MLNWQELLSSKNTEENCRLFLNKITEIKSAISRKGQKRAKNTRHLPWLDSNCRTLMKKRDSLLKQSLKSGLLVDRQKFTHARNKLTHALRKSKANFFMKTIEGAKGNGRKAWQLLNKLLGKDKQESTAIELNSNNILVKDSSVLAQTFNEYFLNSVNDIQKMLFIQYTKLKDRKLKNPPFYLVEINFIVSHLQIVHREPQQ